MNVLIRHIIVCLLLLFSAVQSVAQVSMPDTVCAGATRMYSVNDPTVPSTYNWKIDGVTQTTTTNAISITWTVPGTFLLTVQELSAEGCYGEERSGTVVVRPVTVPEFTAIGPICQTRAAPTLPLVSNNNITGAWSPAVINTLVAGTFTYTFSPDTGQCATVLAMDITINPMVADTLIAEVCANQLPFIWYGNPFNVTGIYYDTLVSTQTCDTAAVLYLTVLPLPTDTTIAAVCANQLPYIWKGNPYSVAGTYYDTISSTFGCDTAAVLYLQINPLLTDTTNVSVCNNQLPFIWYGNNYTATGTYIDTIPSVTGTCDTIAVLNLVVKLVTNSTTIDTTCSNELPYLWNGLSISDPGIYSVILVNAAGCDSLATLNLTINAAPVLVINNPLPVCEPMTVDLTNPAITAGSTPGLTYTYWLDAAATIPLPNPTAVTTGGIYYIKSSKVNNCADIQPVNVVVFVAKAIPGVRYSTITTDAFVPVQLNARNIGVNYSWNPAIGLNSPVIVNPIFNYDRQIEYTVRLITDTGCIVIDTILVKIIAAPAAITRSDLFVPKAWSPNRDGHNDKLFPLTVNIRELKYFRIFNRWGQLVFETNSIGQGWDGFFNGSMQPLDVYTWTAEAMGNDGKIIKKSGNSVLLR